MPNSEDYRMVSTDREILRSLAVKVREIAEKPVMSQRRELWLKHDQGPGERPIVLAESGGVLDDFVPLSSLKCIEEWARNEEKQLRRIIADYGIVNDDHVVEPYINCPWDVTIGDYCGAIEKKRGNVEDSFGSYVWESPIKDLSKDFEKLHFRKCSVDRAKTQRHRNVLEDVFGDILTVRMRGGYWWTVGLTWPAIELIGLEKLMLTMYDEPESLHRLMAFLRDDHIAVIKWLEKEKLFNLNNEDDYIGSGSRGYTEQLPQADFSGNVRAKDLWILSESQETVGVSPEMFEEFIFPYQLPVIEMFGLSYYGCCEALDKRWHIVNRIPNLRRVSVAPWCDQQFMAEALGNKYTFCRKPNPALVSMPEFDEDQIRQDIRNTLDIAKGCNIELVMKDVHNIHHQPERLGRWVKIARQEIAKK